MRRERDEIMTGSPRGGARWPVWIRQNRSLMTVKTISVNTIANPNL